MRGFAAFNVYVWGFILYALRFMLYERRQQVVAALW